MIWRAGQDRPRRKATVPGILAAVLLCMAWGSTGALAQDLTPRTYWPAPKGTRLLIVGYAHQTGDVVTDPSIPITGVDSSIDSAVIAYQQTLDLFGRTGNLQFEVPYVDGTTTGMVFVLAHRRFGCCPGSPGLTPPLALPLPPDGAAAGWPGAYPSAAPGRRRPQCRSIGPVPRDGGRPVSD